MNYNYIYSQYPNIYTYQQYSSVNIPNNTNQLYYPINVMENIHNNKLVDKQDEINPYRIMICGSDNYDINFIRRFMKQIKNYTIVVATNDKLEGAVVKEALQNNLEVRIANQNNIIDKSSRLYSVYSKDRPFKIYILDNDYENNTIDYIFTKYIPNTVDIVVIRNNYYG